MTDRDGTVSTFRSVAALAGISPASGPPADLGLKARWMLASVVDTHANTVTYKYVCPGMNATSLTAVCYPDRITYTGGEIIFHLDPNSRPDHILMANGHDISVTSKRIKSIQVRSAGQLRTAYALTYDQAPF